MEGRRLILNDGTRIENGQAGYADNNLWCYLPGRTIQEMSSLFFDSGKTEKIIFQYGDMQDEYIGFTVPGALIQRDTEAQIMMRKEDANV